ncbi:hypothetical protein HY628_01795 [Candidatus Uhrbacteria bacterium]|nr:hypothetical protein [Candidatus Uhrbacteria bacterium]
MILRLAFELAVLLIGGSLVWFFVGRPVWAVVKRLPSVRARDERRKLQYRERRVELLEQEIELRRRELILLKAEAGVEGEENRILEIEAPRHKVSERDMFFTGQPGENGKGGRS